MKSKIEGLGKVSITVEKDYWDKNKAYNRLTIVERQGTSTAYLSRKVVPIGVDITNRNYWITISKWADIPYEIVQEFGDSTELVISQKVVTLKVNELQELIDNINEIIGEGGSIDERIATAKSELIDGATEEGDTLKKLEDRLSDVEESVGEGGSVDERIDAAKSDIRNNTIAPIDDRLSTIEELAEISVEGGSIGIATKSDFDNPNQEQKAKIPTVNALLEVGLIASKKEETSTGTVTIKPNTLYKFGACSSLAIAFYSDASFANAIKEYMFEFTVSGTEFTLTLPEGVRWNEEPDLEDGYTYQVSIIDNLAVFGEFEPISNE